MVRLQGRRVIIRPLTLDDLEPVFIGRTKLAEEGRLAGTPDRDELRARIPHWGTLRDRRVNLGITVEGRLIGEIQSFPAKTHRAGADTEACELGVSIYDASDRGQGHGTEALRLFVDWLITQGAQQVLGGTAPSNEAMRRVFERAGFIQAQAVEQAPEELTYGLPPIKG